MERKLITRTFNHLKKSKSAHSFIPLVNSSVNLSSSKTENYNRSPQALPSQSAETFTTYNQINTGWKARRNNFNNSVQSQNQSRSNNSNFNSSSQATVTTQAAPPAATNRQSISNNNPNNNPVNQEIQKLYQLTKSSSQETPFTYSQRKETNSLNQKKPHKNSLIDLSDYVGEESAQRIKADLSENVEHGSLNYLDKSPRDRKYYGVVSYWSNYIASNLPCEDRRIGSKTAVTKHNSRSAWKNSTDEIIYIFGVLDGHGGGYCADIIAKRLVEYFMVTQLPPDEIEEYLGFSKTQVSNTTFKVNKVPYKILTKYLNDPILSQRAFDALGANHKDYQPYWRQSLIEFSEDVLKSKLDKEDEFSNTKESLRNAIMRLDDDIAKEALKYASPSSLHYTGRLAKTFKKVATSGCVGSVAVIKQGVVTIAHVGDSRALIGIKSSKTGKWTSKRVTPEHNAYNEEEIERLEREHPDEEVIFKDRILGILQPTRAFGDHRLKQSVEWIEEVFEDDPDVKHPVYPEYISPPYVSNRPKVTRVPLRNETKFLLLASDGFWELFEKKNSPYYSSDGDFTKGMEKEAMDAEMLEQKLKHIEVIEQQVVEFVGQHLDVQEQINNMKLEDINQINEMKEQVNLNFGLEENVATEIVKKALMIDDYGDSNKCNLADMMMLGAEERRMKRDDITCTIVKFGIG